MTNELNSKRLSDDELEAVSGGVTSTATDPAALAAQLMQSQLNAALAVATGGAHPVDTHTATDTGTPTITGQTHTTVSGDAIFGGGSSSTTDSHSSTGSAPASITIKADGDLAKLFSATPAPQPTSDMQVMHFENTQGTFTQRTPIVEGVSSNSTQPGSTYGIANRENIAFNLPNTDDNSDK